MERDFECEDANCGSSSFRIGDDGYTYCLEEGHRQVLRGTQVVEDTEGVPQFGRKARREKDVEENVATALTGKRAFEHCLLCFQLVLWKQIYWLINTKGLPDELETVVRDIWALRLQSLQSRVSYAPESEFEQSSQVYSSQNESDKTDDTTETTKSRKTKNETVPKLVDALSMCYVGCLLLRLPVSINDIHTWAASGELLYYRAVKSLSESMKARLPFNYYKIMDPQDMLDPVNLQQAVLDNVTAYDRAFGMITPPINHILLLYRWIRQLALPLEVYSATLRLAKLLDIEFVYDVQPVRTTRYKVMQYAEARLMGMLVVATKLLFPLDNIKRFPKNPTELSALTMDWAAWSKARVEYNETTKDNARLGYQDAMQMQEKDVIDLSNEKLDDYMDWFGTMFTEETVRETGRVGKEAEFRRTLHRFFPIERVVEEEKTDYMDVDEEPRPNTKTKTVLEDERLKKVQERLKPVRIEESKMNEISDTKRPGNGYKRYRHVKELDGHAREFYEEASTMAALSLELLVKCVFVLEIRLEKWEKSERDK